MMLSDIAGIGRGTKDSTQIRYIFHAVEKCRKIFVYVIGQNGVTRRCFGIAALYLCI